MKKGKELRAASYVAGIFAMASALLLTIFLILTLMGLLHPRQQRLTLYTPSISKIYDGSTLSGSEPEITYGQLHDGHTLEVVNLPQYSRVGFYENAPEFRILDDTGADVTDQYEICKDFGFITIQARQLTVACMGDSKIYDGEPLTADPVTLIGGTLIPGDQLVTENGNSILYPGTVSIKPVYRIISKDDTDVTDQYAVSEYLEKLTVLPRPITVGTESGNKVYDGTPLTASDWTLVQGRLLDNHTIQMNVTTAQSEVGTAKNEGAASILDENGKDISHLYDIRYQFGTLQVQPIALYVSTGSSQKVYDGTPLSCPEWTLTGGELSAGASIVPQSSSSVTKVGAVNNEVQFAVIDEKGKDISSRYHFDYDYGTLSIQPRSVTIRTGSAHKVYDGTPLRCDEFELIQGILMEHDQIEITGVSITNTGYSENYVLDCSVYHIDENGTKTDVTTCYRISFEFGLLTITN